MGLAKHPRGKAWCATWNRILILHEQGKSPEEIGAEVNMHPGAVRKVMCSDRFKLKQMEFEEKAVEKARAVFEKHALEAAKKIVRIAREGKPSDRIQFDACKEVLYQVGMKPIEVVETIKREYTPEELRSAANVLKELEDISSRLSGGRSKFLLGNADEETPPSAPVPAEAEGDEVEEESENTDTTIVNRQENVPEEPILSV